MRHSLALLTAFLLNSFARSSYPRMADLSALLVVDHAPQRPHVLAGNCFAEKKLRSGSF